MRKFTDIIDIDDWEVETDSGFAPIRHIGKTVPYEVWEVKTDKGRTIRCADTHIFLDSECDEVYAKDLNKDSRPDMVSTESGVERVVSVCRTGETECMYDIEVDTPQHRYYSNGFLCHNSVFLANDAAHFITGGKNVVFITCEMSDKKIMKRIACNLFDINIREYDAIASDTPRMKSLIARRKTNAVPQLGSLYIKEYPTGTCTVQDVENTIKRVEEQHLKERGKVNVVVIDYLNIMCNSRMPNSENTYLSYKRLCEDLRAVAVRHDCLIVTATQTNRTGQDTNEIELSHTSESHGVNATVDVMLGIIPIESDGVCREYRLKINKIRDGNGRDSKMKINVDFLHMRVNESGVWYDSEGQEHPYNVVPSPNARFAGSMQAALGPVNSGFTPNPSFESGGASVPKPTETVSQPDAAETPEPTPVEVDVPTPQPEPQPAPAVNPAPVVDTTPQPEPVKSDEGAPAGQPSVMEGMFRRGEIGKKAGGYVLKMPTFNDRK